MKESDGRVGGHEKDQGRILQIGDIHSVSYTGFLLDA
jgi:hypothetical protein